MQRQIDISRNILHRKIKSGEICLAGNIKLGIYGNLNCRSGKRMIPQNRVFFLSEAEAKKSGFRPCTHCMPRAYQLWKLSKKQVE